MVEGGAPRVTRPGSDEIFVEIELQVSCAGVTRVEVSCSRLVDDPGEGGRHALGQGWHLSGSGDREDLLDAAGSVGAAPRQRLPQDQPD